MVTMLNRDRSTLTTVGWRKKSAAYWLQICQGWSTAGQSIKLADDQQSTPFEQAFANLAHSVVAEKAPKLLEYEVGFSLLDKTDENTKAVGVFGFRVGHQWLFAPVFFLNGALKGTELLYLKDRDLFVPMTDGWVDYLLGRKPNIMGREVSRNLSQLGVLSPNLYQLSRSPYKIASASGHKIPELPTWCVDFLPVLAKLALTKVAFPNSELFTEAVVDRKSTRLNSSHLKLSRMPSSA